MIKIISKILDYIPVVFFLLFSFIGLFFIADENHIDVRWAAYILMVMIIYWPITLGSLFFLAGMSVANLFYKRHQK